MRERIVADVVQQRRQPDIAILGYPPGEMIRAERMLEPRVCRAGINEKCMPELPHVPQALKRRGIDNGQSLGLEADVVPEGVANDLKRQVG